MRDTTKLSSIMLLMAFLLMGYNLIRDGIKIDDMKKVVANRDSIISYKDSAIFLLNLLDAKNKRLGLMKDSLISNYKSAIRQYSWHLKLVRNMNGWRSFPGSSADTSKTFRFHQTAGKMENLLELTH